MNFATTLPPAVTADSAASRVMRLEPETVEGRLAMRMASHLSHGSEALPHDITERLRFAREKALAVAQQQRRSHAAKAGAGSMVLHGAGRQQAALSGPPSVWLRIASALPLLVLMAGLVLIQQHREQEQILVAAEIDSALLADELPPTAYGDPGFQEFLHSGAGH